MEKILVLLATYNGEKYLEEQLYSILSQNDVDVHILVGDDNSKDRTVEILKKISEDSRRLTIINNVPGLGCAANFLDLTTKSVKFEEYHYLAFADQDDIWLPDKLISAINMLSLENADLYCSNLTKWDTATNKFSELKKDYPQKKFDFLFEGGSAGCTYVFTRNFAKELQIFLLNLDSTNWKGFSHDWLVYFFARSKKFKVAIDGNSYIHYRLHTENVHGHLNKLSWNTIKEKSSEVFNGYYQKQIKNYIKYVDKDSQEYSIYKKFLVGYFSRNIMILKYNTELMRDNKKFLIFAILNLLKFK